MPSDARTQKPDTVTPPVTAPPPACQLEQIVQYACAYDARAKTASCTPFSRIFRVCPGRPAVEVTAIAKVNSDGGVYVPSHEPKGSPPLAWARSPIATS